MVSLHLSHGHISSAHFLNCKLSFFPPFLHFLLSLPFSPLTCYSLLFLLPSGFSGPAALRLSAFGAKVMAAMGYKYVHYIMLHYDILLCMISFDTVLYHTELNYSASYSAISPHTILHFNSMLLNLSSSTLRKSMEEKSKNTFSEACLISFWNGRKWVNREIERKGRAMKIFRIRRKRGRVGGRRRVTGKKDG